MTKKKDEITLSEKHGVNPSVCHCEICSKEYGVALLGRLKDDTEAPMHILHGLCNECQKYIEEGNIFALEVKDGTDRNNPERTGHYCVLSNEWKERAGVTTPFVYIEESVMKQIFGITKEENKNTGAEDSSNIVNKDKFECPYGYCI